MLSCILFGLIMPQSDARGVAPAHPVRNFGCKYETNARGAKLLPIFKRDFFSAFSVTNPRRFVGLADRDGIGRNSHIFECDRVIGVFFRGQLFGRSI